MNLLESLKTRYATKAFDSSKKIADKDLQEILESFRLAPSGYWLQPWKLVIVENPQLREKLLPHSWNQKQVVDASHLLVFSRVENPGDELVDAYLDDMVATRWASREDLKWYEDMMKWFLNSLSLEAKNAWADRQVFLSSWVVLSLLAEKWIDSCPMEWFVPAEYTKVLELDQEGLTPVLVLPIGYKMQDDKYAILPKVRFGLDKLVVRK